MSCAANSTTVKKLGSFTAGHSVKFEVVLDAEVPTGAFTTFYVSTNSSTSPSKATLDSSNKGKSASKVGTGYYQIETDQLSANTTYYFHSVTEITGSAALTVTVNAIYIGGSYTTTTPCQSMVKSVQRGVQNMGETGIIPINTVAPEKSLVIVDSSYGGSLNYTGTIGQLLLPDKLILFWKTTNQNTIVSMQPYTNVCSWQVIEFY